MSQSPRARIKKLKKQIARHDRLYYNLDRPEISDFEYDRLFKQLADLESQYPKLKTKDSPSQKVPGQALAKFKKSSRELPMLSLQNSYSKEEIKDFHKKSLRLLGAKSCSFFLEPKLDGMAVELIYERGFLTKALTRGDGTTGEDISQNIKTLRGLALSLKSAPMLFEARGEALILKKDFERINREREKKGLPLFANPRNLAAGSLRQLDPKISAGRPLICFIHSPGRIKGAKIKSQEAFLKKTRELSLPCLQLSLLKKLKAPLKLCSLARSPEEILEYYERIKELRPELPFEIDGIVIKVNDFDRQKKLGLIARSPRWALAGKFPPEEKIAQVQDIRAQVGRTGAVTPVAILKPVAIGGVWIRKASLHNFKDLKRKDIRAGDYVLIRRAGDVIPELIGPLKDKRKGLKKPPKPVVPPESCPACAAELKERGDYLVCLNPGCPAVRENKFIHFASKRGMNIEFLGKKSLKKFYEWGWLSRFSDIYDLAGRPLKDKAGFGEKSHKLLAESLERSKKTSLPRLIFALGIPLIGESAAKKISDRVYERGGGDLDIKRALALLRGLSREELEEIEDLGPFSARSFRSAMEETDLISDLERMAGRGLYLARQKKGGAGLKGLSFAITGTLPEPRDKVKKLIEENGGKLLSQVSSKTSYLLEGENPGSKKKKAEALGIKVLGWEDFLTLSR